jgi:Protein tyrosine and serine/threonine kinase
MQANILIKDDGGVCISDPGFNILMRQLKYDSHTPVPATWCYKPREELLSDTFMGPEADVYAWASVAYEVGTSGQHDHIFSNLYSLCV